LYKIDVQKLNIQDNKDKVWTMDINLTKLIQINTLEKSWVKSEEDESISSILFIKLSIVFNVVSRSKS